MILEYGDSGNQVIILQEKLKILGYYPQTITGSYGELTREAVLKFQEDNSLTPTGNVNLKTWEKLFEKTAIVDNSKIKVARPVLKLGSKGQEVEELQRKLKTLFYYNDEITGYFGAITEKAVREFQANNKLTADGIVGRNTWDALEFLYKPLAICGGTAEEPEEENEKVYIVKAGDTLYSIARRYNITVEELKEWNNLSSNIISIGQKLYVAKPEVETIYDIHVVKKGDTLYGISKMHDTTVDEIKRINNLTNDIISIGQKLKVPKKKQTIYVVVKGDTLYSIAKKFGTTVDKIKALNGINSDIISIGQQLIVK